MKFKSLFGLLPFMLALSITSGSLFCESKNETCEEGMSWQTNNSSYTHQGVIAEKRIKKPNTTLTSKSGFMDLETKSLCLNTLGKPINIKKGNPIDVNSNNIDLSANVFTSDFLDEMFEKSISYSTSSRQTTTLWYAYGKNRSELTKSIKTNLESSSSIDASYACYEAAVQQGFGMSNELTTSEIVEQFFHRTRIEINSVDVALYGAGSEFSYYSEHLSRGFLEYLDGVKSGLRTWNQFFDTFGTHVLTAASFGGYCDIDYCVSSSKRAFSTSNVLSIESAIKGKGTYEGVTAEVGNDIKTKIENALSCNKEDINVEMTATTIGGPIEYQITQTDPNMISESINEWKKNLSKTYSILKYRDAEPIWNYIPVSKYGIRFLNDAEDAFEEYMPRLGELETQNRPNTYTDISLKPYGDDEKVFGTGAWDLNRYDFIDTITFDNTDLKNFKILKNCGYNIVKIGFSFYSKKAWSNIGSSQNLRINLGTTYTENNNDKLLLAENYGPDSTTPSYFKYYFSIDLNKCIDREGFTFRFYTNSGDFFCGRKALVSKLKFDFTYIK